MYERILQNAISTYGNENQMVVAMEELAELQKELSKHIRGIGDRDHLAEEVADVEIMLEQVKMIFDLRLPVSMWKEHKLDRLNRRIKEEKNESVQKDREPAEKL